MNNTESLIEEIKICRLNDETTASLELAIDNFRKKVIEACIETTIDGVKQYQKLGLESEARAMIDVIRNLKEHIDQLGK